MNSARHVTMLMAMALAVFRAERAVACPHCNIHNHLASSVQSSTNIFLGEVLRQVADGTAEIKVLKVLRGTHKVGSKVTSKMWRAERHVGERFIFSDPTSHPPTFEVLSPEFEDEVLFLIQEEPSVGNMEEAVKRVQGVSVVTQEIGMKYIEEHHDAALKPLLAELDSLMPAVFSGKEVFFGEHRLGKLVEALLLKSTDTGREFVFSQIDALPRQQPPPIEWKIWPVLVAGAIGLSILLAGLLWLGMRVFLRWRFPYNLRSLLIFVTVASLVLGCAAWYLSPWLDPVRRAPSARGVFLRDMLCQTEKHQALSTAVKERMSEICLTLSGSMLAETVYAMLLAEVATPEELQTQLTNRESAEMLALGLYFAGNHEARWWQHEEAYALWDKALSVARKRELKAAIGRRIGDSERIWERRNNDPN